jgi:hypothetical protein
LTIVKRRRFLVLQVFEVDGLLTQVKFLAAVGMPVFEL